MYLPTGAAAPRSASPLLACNGQFAPLLAPVRVSAGFSPAPLPQAHLSNETGTLAVRGERRTEGPRQVPPSGHNWENKFCRGDLAPRGTFPP